MYKSSIKVISVPRSEVTAHAQSRLQIPVILLSERQTLLRPRLHDSCDSLHDSLVTAYLAPVQVHGVQLALAQVVDNPGPDRVADDVDGGPAPVQEPVHGQDDGDVIRGEAHRLQDHHHCHESSLEEDRLIFGAHVVCLLT